jgi:hypothetical protein
MNVAPTNCGRRSYIAQKFVRCRGKRAYAHVNAIADADQPIA